MPTRVAPIACSSGTSEITFQDLTRSVVSEGVEATLARLYDAGIHVSVEEFKGRRPILRSGLEVSTKPHDFDNPLITGHLEGRTSGSKGPTISRACGSANGRARSSVCTWIPRRLWIA